MRKTRISLPVFCLIFLLISGAAFASPSEEAVEVLEAGFQALWEEAGTIEEIQIFRFGVVDWKGESVTTRGQAPLQSPSSQSRMLAKRAAISDARRNLLYLLYEIRHGLPERITSIEIEGEVVDGQVDFHGIKNGLYTVEITVPLQRFFSESKIHRAEVK